MDSVGFGDWVVGSRTSPLHLVGWETPWGTGVGVVTGRPFPRLHPRGQTWSQRGQRAQPQAQGGDRCPLRCVPQGLPAPHSVSPALVSRAGEICCWFSVTQCVQLFVTPWTAAHQASQSFTTSKNLLKLMSIESMTPSNYFILCFEPSQ